MLKNLLDYPFFRRSLCLIVIYFLFHAAALELRASRQYRQVLKWPTIPATVASARVTWTKYSWSWKGNRDCPQLLYKYSLNGNSYFGKNEVFDFVCWPDAYDFVAQHPPGSTIQIAYDPASPATSIVPSSVRDPGYPYGDAIGGVILVLIVLVDVFASWTRSDRIEDHGLSGEAQDRWLEIAISGSP